MKVNTAALRSNAQRMQSPQKSSASKKFLNYFDLKRLERETGIKKLRMEAGKVYHLDFLPWPLSESHPSFKELQKVWNPDWPLIDIFHAFVHEVKTPNGKQRFLCPNETLGRDCPLCEKYWRIYNSNKDKGYDKSQAFHASKDELIPLKTKERDLAFVYNRDDNELYFFDMSHFMFGENLSLKLSETNGTEAQPILGDPSVDGPTIRFMVKPSNMKDDKGNPLPGEAINFTIEERESAVPDDIVESLPSLDEYLIEYDYDTIDAILDGTYFVETDEDEDEDDEYEPTTEPPARERRPSRTELEDDDRDLEENNPLDGKWHDTGNSSAYSVEEEVDPREERRRRREARAKEKSADPTCPVPGGTFGEDTDTFDECDNCELYDACDKRYEETHR